MQNNSSNFWCFIHTLINCFLSTLTWIKNEFYLDYYLFLFLSGSLFSFVLFFRPKFIIFWCGLVPHSSFEEVTVEDISFKMLIISMFLKLKTSLKIELHPFFTHFWILSWKRNNIYVFLLFSFFFSCYDVDYRFKNSPK